MTRKTQYHLLFMNILLIETATSVCSVALARDGKVLRELHSNEPNAHSAKLNIFARDIFEGTDLDLDLAHIDAVCVGSGPGSYTGLRIGVSSAKGWCYALSKPLLAVPSLEGMASWYYMQHPEYNGLVCPMIDARRMECYTAVYDKEMRAIKPIAADIIEEENYADLLQEHAITFIGDGAAKTRTLLGGNANAHYDETFTLNAAGLLPLALRRYEAKQFEDVAYFEPFYLKDFVAKKSVVHGLRD